MNAAPRLPYNLRLIPFWSALPIEAFCCAAGRTLPHRALARRTVACDGRSGKAAALRSLTLLLTDPCSSTTLDLNNTGDQTP